jgi:hypothetical protein
MSGVRNSGCSVRSGSAVEDTKFRSRERPKTITGNAQVATTLSIFAIIKEKFVDSGVCGDHTMQLTVW